LRSESHQGNIGEVRGSVAATIVGVLVAAIVVGLIAACANLNNLSSGPADAAIEAGAVPEAAPAADGGDAVEAGCAKGTGCLGCCYAAQMEGARLFWTAAWDCLCAKELCTSSCADGGTGICERLPAVTATACIGCLDGYGPVQCYDNGTYGCPDSGTGAAECLAYGACAMACGK
jgi:hypothetical protein